MLVSITRSQSASLISSVGTRLVVPAAYTMMSSRPKVSTQASLTRSSSDVSATSAGTRRVRRPRPSISAATASTFAARRPVTTTSAPASARPRAMARPMPLVPPTTTARRPERSNSLVISNAPRGAGERRPFRGGDGARGPRLGLLRLILARLDQMRAHQRAGVLGMSLADGVEDPLVHARRVFQVPEAGARDHAPPPLVIEHRHHLDQRRDDRIARRRGDRPVEVDVVHEKAVRIGQRREHPPHLHPDGLDLCRRGPLGGEARGADLEDAPRLVHLLARKPVQRGEKAQRFAAERRRTVRNIRARPAPRLDDANRRQGLEPGTDGRAAHADVHRQLTLGRQAIAGAQGTALDARANVAHDLVGDCLRCPVRCRIGRRAR